MGDGYRGQWNLISHQACFKPGTVHETLTFWRCWLGHTTSVAVAANRPQWGAEWVSLKRWWQWVGCCSLRTALYFWHGAFIYEWSVGIRNFCLSPPLNCTAELFQDHQRQCLSLHTHPESGGRRSEWGWWGEKESKGMWGKVWEGRRRKRWHAANREDSGGESSKIAGATFREQSQLLQSAADFSWCLSAFLFVFHCLLSSSSFGPAAAAAAAAAATAAAAAATWLSLQWKCCLADSPWLNPDCAQCALGTGLLSCPHWLSCAESRLASEWAPAAGSR